jgi:AraC-like DNA-binding protein
MLKKLFIIILVILIKSSIFGQTHLHGDSIHRDTHYMIIDNKVKSKFLGNAWHIPVGYSIGISHDFELGKGRSYKRSFCGGAGCMFQTNSWGLGYGISSKAGILAQSARIYYGYNFFYFPPFTAGIRGDYLFDFTYKVHYLKPSLGFSFEALHLSDKEKETLLDCVIKLENELTVNIDKHSQTLISSNIELLLNYCNRYYDRQFITRKKANTDLLVRFENSLNNYFNSGDLQKKGLPSVKYFAEKLFLSPNYLSDLLKKETGKNAQEHIHYYLIEEAKNILTNSDNTVSEIAYSLGFEYPNYFSKLFKSKTGMTPIEYRNVN